MIYGSQNLNQIPIARAYQPQNIGYQPQYAPQPTQYYTAPPMPTPAPQPQSDIQWVKGIAGAKAYSLGPGRSALLMDSESSRFYIKSTDQAGMQLPLRVYVYTEEMEPQKENMPDMSKYLTKEDFGRMLEEYLGPSIKKEG